MLDVHYSSGVANRFYYLLAEGSATKTFGGMVEFGAGRATAAIITGIGRAKAERIWYRALTVYFTSTTDYAGARARRSPRPAIYFGTTSVEAARVAAAWSAVAVD